MGPVLLVLLGAFLALKLSDTVDWPWWQVLSPLWVGVAGIAFILVLGGSAAAISFIFGRRRGKS